jgi:hypothetical protein
MTDDAAAAQTAELAKKLEQWAKSTGAKDAQRLVVDTADLYRAALAYVAAVERLIARIDAPTKEHAKTLVEIQTWLYDELEDHLQSLRAPLGSVIDELYGRSS